jgi:hypothetical protein
VAGSNVKPRSRTIAVEALRSSRKVKVLHMLGSCLHDSPIIHRGLIMLSLQMLHN